MALLFFLKKQSRTANFLLGLVMLILAFQHFMHYLWATHKVYQYPWLLNIDLPLDGSIAPLLFFYLRLMTGEQLKFKWIQLLHFWPMAVGAVWYIYFNLQPYSFQSAFIDTAYREVPLAAAIVNVLLAVYLGLGYRRLDKYIKAQSDTEWITGYNNLGWLRQFVAILFFINLFAAPLNLIAKFEYLFIGLPVLTAFVMVFVVYKTFNHPEVMSTELVRKFTRQLEYQKELEKVRGQISGDIHDELGAGLTQISMISELGKIQNNTNPALTTEFDKLINLSKSLMGSLREVVWAINPVHDNLASLQAFLRQYLSAFFETTDIQLTFDIQETPENIHLAPALRRNLILVVKEAANNIIKHAAATQVVFKCVIENNQLLLQILDNGKGNPHTETVLGNGMKTIKKRIAESGGTVETSSPASGGFILTVYCPLSNITQK
ncbi:MAG: histidine kinase [Chitinophagales bacterium]